MDFCGSRASTVTATANAKTARGLGGREDNGESGAELGGLIGSGEVLTPLQEPAGCDLDQPPLPPQPTRWGLLDAPTNRARAEPEATGSPIFSHLPPTLTGPRDLTGAPVSPKLSASPAYVGSVPVWPTCENVGFCPSSAGEDPANAIFAGDGHARACRTGGVTADARDVRKAQSPSCDCANPHLRIGGHMHIDKGTNDDSNTSAIV